MGPHAHLRKSYRHFNFGKKMKMRLKELVSFVVVKVERNVARTFERNHIFALQILVRNLFGISFKYPQGPVFQPSAWRKVDVHGQDPQVTAFLIFGTVSGWPWPNRGSLF